MKIFFLDKTHDILPEMLEKHGFQTYLLDKTPITDVFKQLHEANGIVVRSRLKVDGDFMDQCPNLQCIARVGSGIEGIDPQALIDRGITCLNAPEGNRDAVAEHATGLILNLINNICKADSEVRKGIWLREENRGSELLGKTLAIIGYGNTGSEFAKRMKAFRMRIIAYDKYKTAFSDEYVDAVSMNEVFEQADFLSLHIPQNHETLNLVDDNFLKRFTKNIFLINTSRGKIVKTASVVNALKSGKLKGAALDVLEEETEGFTVKAVDCETPLFQLLHHPKVILSPHVAGWTFESEYRLAHVLAQKIISFYKT